MKEMDEDEWIDVREEDDFYINEDELLEDDQIDTAAEAFLRGYRRS